jgi:hypothetical protein
MSEAGRKPSSPRRSRQSRSEDATDNNRRKLLRAKKFDLDFETARAAAEVEDWTG